MSVLQHSAPLTARAHALPLAVVAAPLLVLASELIAPREPEGKSPTEEVAFLLDNSTRLTVSWVIGMVAAAALAAAYVVVAGRLPRRGRRVGRVAATLGVLGAAGLAAHYGSLLTTLDVALHDSSLSGAIVAVEDGRAAMAALPPVILGFNLAIVLLSVAAFRAGWVPAWGIGLGAAALVADFSPTAWNTALHALFAAALFAAIALGASDREPA